MKILRKIRNLLIFACIMIVLAIIGLNDDLKTIEYVVKTDKLSQGIRAVFITDLHNNVYGNDQSELIDMVLKNMPDIVFLVGDIFDSKVALNGGELLIKGLFEKVPLYYVSGNHELWNTKITEVDALLEKYRVRRLVDEYIKLNVNDNSIIIAGIDDFSRSEYIDRSYVQKKSMDKAFASIAHEETFKILLAHRPERIDTYMSYGFDLVLSGHTHGGQIRIPFLVNGFYAPNQGFFPKYGGGKYEIDGTTLIVNRGAVFETKVPRVFNNPEVVIVDIEPKN